MVSVLYSFDQKKAEHACQEIKMLTLEEKFVVILIL
jgi:hypothetical protein